MNSFSVGHFPLAPSINAAASRSKSAPESKAFTSHPRPTMIFLSPGFFFVKSTFCPFDKLIGISSPPILRLQNIFLFTLLTAFNQAAEIVKMIFLLDCLPGPKK